MCVYKRNWARIGSKMSEELTLIRVKRKVTDDPEKGIQFSAKKVRLYYRNHDIDLDVNFASLSVVANHSGVFP